MFMRVDGLKVDKRDAWYSPVNQDKLAKWAIKGAI